jgi:hypothetical protein
MGTEIPLATPVEMAKRLPRRGRATRHFDCRKAHVVHEDIRRLNKIQQRGARLRSLQVQHNAPLVPVDIQEIGRHPRVSCRPKLSKIRAIGVSNHSPAQMEVFRKVARLDAVQPPYNLFEREIEADVLPYARATGLTVLSYGALCRGLLSGKMNPTSRFTGDDLRKVDPKFQGKHFRQYLAAVDELNRLARQRFDKSVLALALRWVLDQGPTIALWGARHPGQLDPINDIEGWHIDAATMSEIDEILKRCVPEPISPEFMAPPLTPPAVHGTLRRHA